ncbi:MAG: portal protein [Candidatus Gastranaerophilales bacterium]|nr:portal protein [Candidatus Gastranaerophilales bacterium]
MAEFAYNKTYFEKRRAELDEEFNQIKPDLQELSDYLQPRMSRFLVNDVNKPIKKSKKILDSCPLISVKNFAAGMQSGATSAATRWFKSQIKNQDLMQDYEVRLWCNKHEELTRTILQKSNFYQRLLGAYKQLAVFGFSCLSMESDFNTVVNFKLLPIGSYRYSKDFRGEVDTVCRNFKEKAKNIVEKFGKANCSDDVLSAAENSPEKLFELVHFVEPNKERKTDSPFAFHKQFISVTYEVASGKILNKSGFERFPYVVFESETNGEDTYPNSCPGIDALPDVRQLMSMTKEYAKAVKKIVSPAYKGPASMKGTKISDAPGMFIPTDDQGNGISPVYEVNIRILELKEEINELKQTVKEHFYNDLFAVILNTAERGRTATEVNEIKEEKMVLLSPLLDQVHKALRYILEWIFYEEIRVQILKTPPEIIKGEELEMEFVSTLAQAQKTKGLASLERFTTFTVNLAQAIDPTLCYKLNGDKIVDDYAAVANINPEHIVPSDEVNKKRQEIQKQQEEQKQMAALQQGSEMIKNIGGVDSFGGDMLSRMGVG